MPVEIRVIDLPESEKFAPDGTPLKLIGKEISKKLEHEHMFAWNGVTIPRGTMARWLTLTAEAAQGVWNILEDKLLASPYVSCDETHVQVLKEKGRNPQSQSYMWIRSTPAEQEKIVLFDYDPSRNGAVQKSFSKTTKDICRQMLMQDTIL